MQFAIYKCKKSIKKPFAIYNLRFTICKCKKGIKNYLQFAICKWKKYKKPFVICDLQFASVIKGIKTICNLQSGIYDLQV